jgi:putative tricarboxylic transport membrane protein
MLIGIGLGFAVGILPGLGGPTTLALMLPFVFKMNPVEAFAFLLGMAAVTNTTGDITSILFGIPGEPTTASTIVDGHPMAKHGEAGRALGAAITSSLFGAVFGALVLGLAIPIVRPLVLTFGSPEFFMLALLGITFVASLSGEAVLKGLLAGCLGLWFATIGLAPVSAIQRYTFGQLFLWDGIGLVPVTIGFFAIPEVIDLAIQGSSIAKVQVGRLGGVWQGVRDTFTHWALVLRCSAIGTFVAIIPGMGAATTQWLAYAHAVQSSRHRERFGQGTVEGVLGPGAANNSTLGGSLVTTVAFGVPASVTMAILMGAFLIQGLVPGPSMLTPAPKGHLAVTFSMVWTIVVSNIITVAICFLFLRQLVKITQVRGALLIPFILMLIAVGAFAEKNVFEDVLIVLLFGALGWVMSRLGWPRPPLLLGLVLGPLAENKLFLSTGNYGLAWLMRPGVLILFAIILLGFLVPILSRRRQRGTAAAAVIAIDPAPGADGTRRTWRVDGATAFSALIVIVFAWALWQSLGFGVRAGLFPWAVCAPGLLLGLVQLARDLTGRREAPAGEAGDDADTGLPAEVVKRRSVEICLWIGGFWIALWLVGFSIATLLMTFLYLRVSARERWLMCVVLTACTVAFVYGLFEKGLRVPFPAGQLFTWLGLA